MKTTATDMSAMFAVAQLNVTTSNLSVLSDDVSTLYTGAILEKCQEHVTKEEFIDAVKAYLVDPALFTSKLNTMCLNVSSESVKPLSLLWNHLYNFGNIHAKYQSQVESVLANLKNEHLQ